MFEEITAELMRHDTIIIHRHHHPDGDALGSQIGLKHLIERNLPGKKVYIVGDAAGRYSFMAGSVMDTVDDSLYPQALAVILDTSSPALISDTRYTAARRTVRIARENVIFAIGVKLLVLVLAAFGLATMGMAVFADVGVTVLAVLNAMRALKS